MNRIKKRKKLFKRQSNDEALFLLILKYKGTITK